MGLQNQQNIFFRAVIFKQADSETEFQVYAIQKLIQQIESIQTCGVNYSQSQ